MNFKLPYLTAKIILNKLRLLLGNLHKIINHLGTYSNVFHLKNTVGIN